ncbi:MAG: di-trans,poly-cis-decaprenylcistransferase [Planctomycetes bacterium]|nr:di-trans,poly-cis-decaprenylcistransferase [Planctomycetota bacterium]
MGEGAPDGTRVDLPAEKLPRHIAFIMDGNGRWARTRGLPRLLGHENGASSLRRVTRRCRSLGIPEITFFALSTENFQRRPKTEVGFLMKLLKSYLVSEREELLENDIRLKAVGDVEALPADVRAELAETERLTRDRGSMVLRLALNYGARQEILEAVARIAREARAGRLTEEDVRALGERGFRRYLADPEMTDPDLLIRTAGEYRLSNFLLWQCSYTEIWVTQELWPDFDVPQLDEALRAYCSRERKYGAVSPADLAARCPQGHA